MMVKVATVLCAAGLAAWYIDRRIDEPGGANTLVPWDATGTAPDLAAPDGAVPKHQRSSGITVYDTLAMPRIQRSRGVLPSSKSMPVDPLSIMPHNPGGGKDGRLLLPSTKSTQVIFDRPWDPYGQDTIAPR